MKNKELVEKLTALNPEAEVGYECLSIARAWPDCTNNYIDLSGERTIPSGLIGSTGVFVVISKYEELVPSEEGSVYTKRDTEVSGIYSTKEKAEKVGKWLMDAGDTWNGKHYLSYKVENFKINK